MNVELARSLVKILLLSTLDCNTTHAKAPNPIGQKKLTFEEQHLEIDIEIADDQRQRERGLMHRPHLNKNQGMLFVYNDENPIRVWMKNTLIPLDVLFINRNNRIVSMLENLQPCKADPCAIYNSAVPAMYMLEVNAGFIRSNNLKIGQALRLP